MPSASDDIDPSKPFSHPGVVACLRDTHERVPRLLHAGGRQARERGEDPSKRDYPTGFTAIQPWLTLQQVKVFNYSIPRFASAGRETFHAKVVVVDRRHAYLGSSNVTAASLDHSMETGVTLEGKAVAEVAEVIDAVLLAAKAFGIDVDACDDFPSNSVWQVSLDYGGGKTAIQR